MALFGFLESVCATLQVCELKPPASIKLKNVHVDAASVLNDVQGALGREMDRVCGGSGRWLAHGCTHAAQQRTAPWRRLSLIRTHPGLRLAVAGSRIQSSWRHTVPAAL